MGTIRRGLLAAALVSASVVGTGAIGTGTAAAAQTGASVSSAPTRIVPPVIVEKTKKKKPKKAKIKLDKRCQTGRAICVDKTARKVRWVVDGKTLLTLDARFGGYGTPTREGTFHVLYKDIDHVSSLFGSSMPYAMFFSGGQAVHYSSDFHARGYNGASHGCVNTRNFKRMGELFSKVHVGDKVIVYRS